MSLDYGDWQEHWTVQVSIMPALIALCMYSTSEMHATFTEYVLFERGYAPPYKQKKKKKD